MKKNFLFGILFILAVLCISVLSATANDQIRVAINPDAKPFKYLDEDGKFAGIDAEVMNAIAESEGLDVEYVEMSFEDILDAVANCEVDAAISAITVTPERSSLVTFSEPYVMGMQSVFVRLKNDGLADISDPAIKVIGAKAGTTAERNARAIAEMFNNEVKVYADYESLFQALESDEIDAAIADELLVKQTVDSIGDIMSLGQAISAETYAIAVCPSNTDLVTKINKGLNTYRRSGKLDEIVLENLMK